MNALGFLTFLQGDYERSRPLLSESIAIWRAIADHRGLVESLTNLGVLLRCIGDGMQARRCFEEAIALSRELGDLAWEGRTLNKLARLTYYEGDLVTARALHDEGLAAVRHGGNTWDVAIALGDQADVCHALGDHLAAERLYGQSLRLWLELGEERGIAQALEGFAILATSESRSERAVRLLGCASEIRARITEPNSPSRRVVLEGILEHARQHLGPSFDLLWAAGRSTGPAQAAAEALANRPSLPPAPVEVREESISENPGILTDREMEVVELIARGFTNPRIAAALVLSRRTVEWHVGNILGKLELRSRTQLVHWAHERDVPHDDGTPGTVPR